MAFHKSVLLAVCALCAISNTAAWAKYVELFPNSQLVEELAHKGEDHEVTAFGDAFAEANHSWAEFCPLKSENGIAYGQLLNDPCCRYPAEKPVEITAILTSESTKDCKKEGGGGKKEGGGGKKEEPSPSEGNPEGEQNEPTTGKENAC